MTIWYYDEKIVKVITFCTSLYSTTKLHSSLEASHLEKCICIFQVLQWKREIINICVNKSSTKYVGATDKSLGWGFMIGLYTNNSMLQFPGCHIWFLEYCILRPSRSVVLWDMWRNGKKMEHSGATHNFGEGHSDLNARLTNLSHRSHWTKCWLSGLMLQLSTVGP